MNERRCSIAQPAPEGEWIMVRLKSKPDDVKMVSSGKDMSQLLVVTIKAEFGLEKSTTIQLYSTDDHTEVVSLDQVSARTDLTVCVEGESY
eukprot:m.296419 g.296419  ORF g.296419 m.296419 type:complete len:91 (+) comp69356_c0_seq1:329-601(+)